ncbi:hypothetical protein Q427_21315 [Halomonas sp. BC04]|nr:hypothetical protein Q427_21315 [Halomonas sp. BC04]
MGQRRQHAGETAQARHGAQQDGEQEELGSEPAADASHEKGSGVLIDGLHLWRDVGSEQEIPATATIFIRRHMEGSDFDIVPLVMQAQGRPQQLIEGGLFGHRFQKAEIGFLACHGDQVAIPARQVPLRHRHGFR